MTPEAQQIAIAKMCPTVVEWHDDKPYWKGAWSSAGEGNEHFAEFNPLCDLGAVWEAEQRFNNSHDAGLLANALQLIVLGYPAQEDVQCLNGWARYRISHATAAQRVEAILRVKGEWIDQAVPAIRGQRSFVAVLDEVSYGEKRA